MNYITKAQQCQEAYKKKGEKIASKNQGESLYIINSVGIAYHHGTAVDIIRNLLRYIINA